jgi:hypothetical protein
VAPFSPEAVAFRAGRLMLKEISLYPFPFEFSDEENRPLQEENARLRRMWSAHGIAIPQLPQANPPPAKTVGTVQLESKVLARATTARWFLYNPLGRTLPSRDLGTFPPELERTVVPVGHQMLQTASTKNPRVDNRAASYRPNGS